MVEANLECVEFGEIRSLKLQENQKVRKIAYSPNGKQLAVDVGDETIIFENIGIRKIHWKEKGRFPGYFLKWFGALNGAQVITIISDRNLKKRRAFNSKT